MKKPMHASTWFRLLILATTMTLLSGCLGSNAVSDQVVAQRTLQDRQACAGALADSDIGKSRAACLVALERLAAGFGE